MKKIMVIGCPGGGKSTFSRALHEITGIPLCHLDMLFWNSDKTTVDREVFLSRLEAVLQGDEWIIDGNYSSTMELRLSECDTVFFLDYPTELCLEGVRQRRGKVRPDMPWIESEEDEEFMEFIRGFSVNRRPGIYSLLEKYSHKNVVVLSCREQADGYLQALAMKCDEN